jgi:alginate O-acetyltransferase complex protein AlgI
MVFASLTFLCVFLPLSLVGNAVARTLGAKNAVLIFFSLIFYAWGEPIWLSLLLVSSASDWLMGLGIEKARRSSGPLGGERGARLALLVSLVVNLSLLGTFKYADLIVTTVNDVLGVQLRSPGFALPIGISFYTFQTISYTVDVYRGQVPAQRSFARFLLFVSLFHQLVAGPIVRYADIAHEIENRSASPDDVAGGVSRLVIGLFKKVCLANVAGAMVAKTLDGDLDALGAGSAVFGLLMYTLQIYFDFSGYSDMAIGLGLMLGFHYLENFNTPYIARSVTDFWRRWHMSLGSFFRDYVYIPLGGKKRFPYRNLFIVWGLTGLWHGASWNFVLWGLYYGCLIALERLVLQRFLEALPRALQHLYVMTAVVFGWSLFYFTDSSRLGGFFRAVTGGSAAPAVSSELLTMIAGHAFWLILAVVCCTPWPARFFGAIRDALRAHAQPTLSGGVITSFHLFLLLCSIASLVGNTYNPFLYFRF